MSIGVTGVPERSLIDEPVQIALTGVVDSQRVMLSTEDDAGQRWSSGRLPVGDLPRDSSKLFWSMRTETPSIAGFLKRSHHPLKYRLAVTDSEGIVLHEHEFEREVASPDVAIEVLDAETSGLAGEFYYHQTESLKLRPLVLVFGGNGGGIDYARRAACLLASRGIPALALAYFAYPGRPHALTRIEIEYFQSAIRWLRARSGNDEAKVTVIGNSRGGELSLILGTLFGKSISKIIARVPSSIVWGGIGTNPLSLEAVPAWIHEGRALGFVPFQASPKTLIEFERRRRTHEPIALTPLFRIALDELKDLCSKAEIEVEKIAGPLLLLSSEDDQVWPSTYFCERIMDRLRSHGKGQQARHLAYPQAGHAIPFPSLPSTQHEMYSVIDRYYYRNGGSDGGDARAAVESWREMLDFIENA